MMRDHTIDEALVELARTMTALKALREERKARKKITREQMAEMYKVAPGDGTCPHCSVLQAAGLSAPSAPAGSAIDPIPIGLYQNETNRRDAGVPDAADLGSELRGEQRYRPDQTTRRHPGGGMCPVTDLMRRRLARSSAPGGRLGQQLPPSVPLFRQRA